MADRNFEITVRIDGESSGLQKDLEAVKSEVQSFKSELADLNKELLGATGSIKSVSANAKALAVDLGYAERSMQSLTRYTRLARDGMASLTGSLKDTMRGMSELDGTTKMLSDAQASLAERLDAIVVPAFNRQADALATLSKRMIMTGEVTNQLARDQRDAALAAELEASAIGHMGDEAEIAAAKMELLNKAEDSAGRSAAGAGIMSRLGAAMQATDFRGLMYHRGFLGNLPWWLGGGLLGGLGAGGILPMTGLGPERMVTSALAIGGSAAAGAAGGAVVGSGLLGRLAVGGGSDAAVMKSTIADTQTLYQQYTALQNAVQTYGAQSRQAVAAQDALNQSMKSFGPAAQAELQLAKNVSALNTMWDQVTGSAREAAVKILDQVVQLGHDYVGRVATAAQENLSVINDKIKPLFAWLEGPQGVGVWNDLEKKFKQDLPYAVDAFNQAVELILRTMDYASQHTGGFIVKVDDLLRYLNSPGFALDQHLQKLIDDFRIWEQFLKYLMLDIVDLVKQGAGEGNSLIELFTQWLKQFHSWETSIQGSQTLHTFFKQRADELIALLHLLPPIVSGFGKFYLALQPLVPVWTAIFKGINAVVGALNQVNPAATTALAGFLMFRKYLNVGGIVSGLTNTTAAGVAAGAAASASGAVGQEAQLGLSDLVGGGVAGGLAAGLDKAGGIISKYGPLLKAGLAFWVGSSVISGFQTALSSDTTKYIMGTQLAQNTSKGVATAVTGFFNTVNSLTFGAPTLLTHLLGGKTPNDQINAIKHEVQQLGQQLQQALGSNSWQAVNRVTDALISMSQRGVSAVNPLIRQLQYLHDVTTGLGTVTPSMAQKVITSFQQVRTEGGSAIQNMQQIVAQNMSMIKSDVGTNSKQAKQDLALNFYAAARFMEGNYAQMGVSTQKAMAFINRMLQNAIKALGVNIPKGINLDMTQSSQLYNTLTSGLNAPGGLPNFGSFPGAATGGIFGSPNAASTDMYHVVMGEGEAILTRHQRAYIDNALPGRMTVGGVVGSIQKPHYAAIGFAGGSPAGAGTGGSDVALPLPRQYLGSGSVDQGVDYSAPAGTPEYAMGPGTIGGEGIGGFGPWAPWLNIDAGPLAGRSIYYGHAGPNIAHTGQHVAAGQQITQVGAGIVGISTGPHLEIGWYPPGPMGAGASMLSLINSLLGGHTPLASQIGGGGAFGAVPIQIPQIPNTQVKDLGHGLLDAVAQGAVNKYHDAAQQYINHLAQSMGASSGSGGYAAEPGGWFRVGATIDNTGGQTGDPNMTFAELLEAGTNAGMRPDLTQLLGKPRGAYGMPMGTSIGVRMPGAKTAYRISKNDVGSGQAGNAHYKIDLHPGIAHALGWIPNEDVEVHAAIGAAMDSHRLPPRPHPPKPTKIKTTPSTHKPKKGHPVKNIPGIPNLVDPFNYFYDTHAIDEPLLHYGGQANGPMEWQAGIKYINYAGGNIQAISQAGSLYSLLQGVLGLVDDTDPNTGAFLTDPKYIYGENYYYFGDPGNPTGLAGAWKIDQQIAAQMAILQMMVGENSGASRELARLGRWDKRTGKTFEKVLGRSVAETADLSNLETYKKHLALKRSREAFTQERSKIHLKFEELRSALTIKRLSHRLSLAQEFNKARTVLQDERLFELSGVDSNLAPKYRQAEIAAINVDFDNALSNLQAIRSKASTSDMIGQATARLFLTQAETNQLATISSEEQKYSQKDAAANLLIYQTQHALSGDKNQARLIMGDLLAADANAITGKETAQLLKIGLDKTVAPGFGGTDIKSEIKQRQIDLNDPGSGIPYIKAVAIPTLLKALLAFTGQAANPTPPVDTTELLTLEEELAQQLSSQLAAVSEQFRVLMGFTPLMGQLVGSFAGGGVIPQTGYALVHRDERILPDPQGPFGTQGGGEGSFNGTVLVQPVIQMKGSLEPLAGFVEAVVARTAQKYVSHQTGTRSRLMANTAGK